MRLAPEGPCGPEFGFEENRRLLAAGDPPLDNARSGLYRRYHLMVAFLIERRGGSVRSMFEDPPAEEEVRADLKVCGRA